MRKQFFVLGIKDQPIIDPKTERDNPYLFNSLERAVEVARAEADYNGYYSAIVVLDKIAEFSGGKNEMG